MNRKLIVIVSVLMSLALASTMVDAKNAKSKDKAKKGQVTVGTVDGSVPPGWSKGKKTGWHGSKYPPGWTKMDKSEQKKWTDERDSAAAAISETANIYKIPEAKQNEVLSAFESAIVGGVIINDAKDKLVNAMKDEKQRKNMMLDTSQTVLELLKD